MKTTRKFKKLAAVMIAVVVLGTAGAVFAAAGGTPADIASALTGKTVEDLYAERAAGKTFGTIASEAGKLDEFKGQMLEARKAVLDQRVKDGTLTQAQADEILNRINENQATCDATGSKGVGQEAGLRMGAAKGAGQGQAAGQAAGKAIGGGMGNRMGTAMRNGTGLAVQ